MDPTIPVNGSRRDTRDSLRGLRVSFVIRLGGKAPPSSRICVLATLQPSAARRDPGPWRVCCEPRTSVSHERCRFPASPILPSHDVSSAAAERREGEDSISVDEMPAPFACSSPNPSLVSTRCFFCFFPSSFFIPCCFCAHTNLQPGRGSWPGACWLRQLAEIIGPS